MSHANAPLTPAGRLRLIERCRTRPIAHVAAEAGVSRACLTKWKRRFDELGVLAHGHQISVVTIGRWFVGLGINRRRDLDPSGANNRAVRKITAQFPGHMIHLDVKKVGRIPDGGGWRAHGRGSVQANTAARAKTKSARAGYVYLHSVIDGYSRLAYTEHLPDENATTTIGFWSRARAFFAAHAITKIVRLITDNGANYKATAFYRTITATASHHQRIRPYTPRHNGKIERYNRILAEELLYSRL